MLYDELRFLVSAIVTLAYLAMAAYAVRRMSESAPRRTATTLAALAGLFGALPAILYAMR